MIYIGHDAGWNALQSILNTYETSKFARLVKYGASESVLMDSVPAPGYVPGAPGKAEFLKANPGLVYPGYTPAGDGTRVHFYYLAKDEADERAVKEALRYAKTFDPREIVGTLVSIRGLKSGNIQLQVVAGNRDNIEKGIRTDKPALRSVSISNDPATNGGVLVALAFDQTLGINIAQLKELADGEEATFRPEKVMSGAIRAALVGGQPVPLTTPPATPAPNPVQEEKK